MLNQKPQFMVSPHGFGLVALPRIPLIEDLAKEPIPAGSTILVEFDSASQWYNASYTITAEWLRQGGTVDYWIAAQPPENMRSQLKRLGLNVRELEETGKLEIWDCYTCQLGRKSEEKLALESLKVADLSIWWSKMQIAGRPPDPTMLRIFDDLSILDRFNDEKSWVELVLTRLVPVSFLRKETGIRGIMRGVQNDRAYSRLEGAFDAIVDFRAEEAGKEPGNAIRIRSMQNVPYDPGWHRLKIAENFEVTLGK